MRKNLGPGILFFIFLANLILGFGYRLYLRTGFFDITLHFFGGMGVYLTLYQFASKDFYRAPRWQFAIMMIGTATLVGVLWEFTEYLGSVFFGKINGIELIGDLSDTLSDLCMDIIGATAGFFLRLLGDRETTRHRRLY